MDFGVLGVYTNALINFRHKIEFILLSLFLVHQVMSEVNNVLSYPIKSPLIDSFWRLSVLFDSRTLSLTNDMLTDQFLGTN